MKLVEVKELLEQFIKEYKKNKITIEEFSFNHEIEAETCKKLFEETRGKFGGNLYKEYVKIKTEAESKSHFDIAKVSKEVLENIKNGIVSENGKREFDIIDFHQMTHYSLKTIRACIFSSSKFSKYDRYRFYKFYVNCCNVSKLLPESIISMKIVVGGKIEGKNIVGGREITLQEKQKIFDYLNESRIPLSMYTFNLAKNRILDLNKKQDVRK